MPKILISYRRSDSRDITGRVFDRLSSRYGKESIFIDVADIPFGTDFRKHILTVLNQTQVLIAVIGPNWRGPGTDGGARIDDEVDPVRIEVETALRKNIPIIAVLVAGTKMPGSKELPPSLRDFSYINAAEVDGGRDFHFHMDRLMASIDEMFPEEAAVSTRRIELPRTDQMQAELVPQKQTPWSSVVAYVLLPVVVLLVAHHVIVNSLNLSTMYLRLASFLIPFAFGLLFSWQARRSPQEGFVVAVLISLIAVTAMVVSGSLNTGDPIVPSTRFEWWEITEYLVSIALSFLIGTALGRFLRLLRRQQTRKP
jgi:TIR domain